MGIRLRQLREARGFTVAQMVGRLGVKDSRYRKWESESAAMPLEYAIRACSVLHCSLDELSGRVPDALASDEQRLLDLYRRSSPKGRECLIGHVGDTVTARHYERPEADAMLEVVARSYAERPFDAGWDWAVWD